jgi:hypothetical protein
VDALRGGGLRRGCGHFGDSRSGGWRCKVVVLMARIPHGVLVWLLFAGPVAGGVDFNRDVRPILSELCFQCHGFDAAARKGDLRLDERAGAVESALVPGDPAMSEMIRRLTSADPDEVMPPPKTGKQATAAQIETLRRWIAEGAGYDTHWSFKPLAAGEAPAETSPGWARNGVDHFVAAALRARGLSPSAEADPATLLRRVTFDLTGLPPTVEALEAYLGDRNPGAYERAVDGLLASKHFGERMAVDWLDAARYADTNGYFGDKTREIWPWRDWVVQAYNDNVPFDVFTIEQLAGDLLPGATVAQRIATGFNRNHMVTNESGAIDEEYRVEYVADRLETTGAVWLGLTVGCARCHDHKYDPLSQREYFQLFAYFNQAVEDGLVREDSPPPVMDVPDAASAEILAKLQATRERAETEFDAAMAGHRPAYDLWERSLAAESPVAPARGLVAKIGFEPGETVARSVGTAADVAGIEGRAAVFDGMQHFELPPTTKIESDRPWTIGWWMNPAGSLSGVLGKVEPGGARRGSRCIGKRGVSTST